MARDPYRKGISPRDRNRLTLYLALAYTWGPGFNYERARNHAADSVSETTLKRMRFVLDELRDSPELCDLMEALIKGADDVEHEKSADVISNRDSRGPGRGQATGRSDRDGGRADRRHGARNASRKPGGRRS